MIEDEEAIRVMFDNELDEFIEKLERLSDLASRERVRRRLREKKFENGNLH